MVVLQAISEGRSEVCACVIAAAIAFWSWPSIRTAFQPWALKRATWSTLSVSVIGPSMVMPLSSYRKISFDSLRCPASAIASWLTPSIRSPSEHST